MRRHLFVSALLGISFVQCSSADKAPKFPDVGSFCKGWAEAECSDAVVKACLAASKDACVAKRQPVCVSTFATQTASLTYDSGQAENCVNQASSAYGDAKVTGAEQDALAKACGLVFSGSGTKGASCTVDADCRQGDGLRCVVHSTSSSSASSDAGGTIGGTCQVPQQVQGGGACSKLDEQCVDGFHCGSTSHCDQDETAGAGCNPRDPCATGLKCSDTGTCVAELADGSACSAPSECANGICLTGVSLCASEETLAANEPFCTQLRQ